MNFRVTAVCTFEIFVVYVVQAQETFSSYGYVVRQ